jgi:ATP-dependent exoDNAse (exonuclease V) alpha subunit
VTVVGHAASISAGEWITASGDWVNDRTHGQQFKARFLRTSPPTSADGIEKYLSSGMIRGVGPVYAKNVNLSGHRAGSKLTAKARQAGQEANARIAAERGGRRPEYRARAGRGSLT